MEKLRRPGTFNENLGNINPSAAGDFQLFAEHPPETQKVALVKGKWNGGCDDRKIAVSYTSEDIQELLEK